MNILFVHNNFPAQFKHIATALAADPDMKVAAIGCPTARAIPGVHLIKYNMGEFNVAATHPFARRFDIECRRAEQVLYSLTSLLSSGFEPDVIMVHPGWGENLPLRGIFPNARIVVYCEFYYGLEGRDVRFDPEFPMMGTDGDVMVQIKNASSLLALSDCDGAVSPTAWQRSTFPKEYLDKIDVIHEGVDVDIVKPNPTATFKLPSGRILTRKDEVVTYVTRNLEPLRGCHIFLRSLPQILKERPNAEVVIVGGDSTSYGAHPPPGKTWKSIFFDEIKDKIDVKRVHFVGTLPYEDYLSVLQISSAHVYLTYPFVTSWSLMEAMSAGCLVVGSDTSPVREVIDDGVNGFLTPFFDTKLLAERVIEVLKDAPRLKGIRLRARESIMERYDMTRRCVPKLMSKLTGRPLEMLALPRAKSPIEKKNPVEKKAPRLAKPKSAPIPDKKRPARVRLK
jgi:glycosyltransferase involved in cell wall biosynthesis